MQLQKATRKNALKLCSDWQPVKGYEGTYEVHWRGIVRNVNGLLLAPGLGKNGYLTLSLYQNQKGKSFYVHSLVANHFIANPFNKRCVNHKDGNKQNNHLSNLEWATHSENNSHAIQIGLKKSINPARGVMQLDLEGNEVARYHSSEHAPYPFSSGNICHVCNGTRLTHGGFKWKFIN